MSEIGRGATERGSPSERSSQHPLTKEILTLCASRHQVPQGEIRARLSEFRERLYDILKNSPKTFKPNDYNYFDAIRGLAILSEHTEEYKDAQDYLEMIINNMPGEGEQWELSRLDLNLDLGAILLKLDKVKAAKQNLKLTNELYQKLKAKDGSSKSELLEFIHDRKLPGYDQTLQHYQVALLKNYFQYYTLVDQPEKIVHNGLLVLKYTLKYGTYEPVEWTQHSADLSPYCCEIRAFRQSYYLLRAAEAMLAKIKHGIKSAQTFDPQKVNEARFLEGRIKLAYVQHCLILMYETKNLSVIYSKMKAGMQLTESQKQELKVSESLTEFEDLSSVPEERELLSRVAKSDSEVRLMYDLVSQYMKTSTELLTAEERTAHGYGKLNDKYHQLQDIFLFLK